MLDAANDISYIALSSSRRENSLDSYCYESYDPKAPPFEAQQFNSKFRVVHFPSFFFMSNTILNVIKIRNTQHYFMYLYLKVIGRLKMEWNFMTSLIVAELFWGVHLKFHVILLYVYELHKISELLKRINWKVQFCWIPVHSSLSLNLWCHLLVFNEIFGLHCVNIFSVLLGIVECCCRIM